MIAYNVSLMPPIMPLLVRQLNTSIGYIQGALVLCSLVAASFAPTCENLGRFYGRNRIFLAGLILYGIGITLTALSPNAELFVVSFALLTGLAAAPLVITPWIMIDFAYNGKSEQQATLAFILSSTIGGLTGAILGGLIASQVGWRWAFAPSLLVFLLVLLGGRSLPKTAAPHQQPIDWFGGLVSFLGFGSILLGLSLAGEYGWWQPKRVFAIAGFIIPPFALSIVPTLISVGVVCLGFFIFWQREQAQRSGASLFRVGLLRKPIFVIGMFTAMLHTLITTGVQFNLYQVLPVLLWLNPFETAMTVIPYTLTVVIVMILLLKRIKLDRQFSPKQIVYLGLMLLIGGLGWLYLIIQPNITSLSLLPPLIMMGTGSALFLLHIGTLTYSVARRNEKPEGTGIYSPMQQLGNSLGRGILGTVLVSLTSAQIIDRTLQALGKTVSPAQRQQAISTLERVLQTYSKEERQELFSQRIPAAVIPELRSIVEASTLAGIRTALLVALAFGCLCLLLATFLPHSVHRQD
jgi:MFS family permease